jgi:hypothetical protein
VEGQLRHLVGRLVAQPAGSQQQPRGHRCDKPETDDHDLLS